VTGFHHVNRAQTRPETWLFTELHRVQGYLGMQDYLECRHDRRGHGRKIGQTSRLGWIPSGFTRGKGGEKQAKRRVVAKARPSGESSDYE
jgi:hypothetical protein